MCRPECEDHCTFDLWAPEGHRDTWNTAFSIYASNFELAARDLAKHPEAQDDEDMQDAICRKYGIFLDQITDDEAEELSRMVESFNF